jgi:hypothetical protein
MGGDVGCRSTDESLPAGLGDRQLRLRLDQRITTRVESAITSIARAVGRSGMSTLTLAIHWHTPLICTVISSTSQFTLTSAGRLVSS